MAANIIQKVKFKVRDYEKHEALMRPVVSGISELKFEVPKVGWALPTFSLAVCCAHSTWTNQMFYNFSSF